MTDAVWHFIEIVSALLPKHDPIYEFGAMQDPLRQDRSDPRLLFPGRTYVGCDLREGRGVDVLADIEDAPIEDGAVGTVLVLETLEHIRQPSLAVEEAARILRPDGWSIWSTVFRFSLHMQPNDFWRFTPHGLRLLLERRFRTIGVWACGEPKNPKHVVAIASPSADGGAVIEAARPKMARWEARWSPRMVEE